MSGSSGVVRHLAAVVAALFAPALVEAGHDGVRGPDGQPPCACLGCRQGYSSDSCLYGYQDHAFGRGPLIELGSGNLQPSFRGYGVFGSPGFGPGLRPATRIDLRPNRHPWSYGRLLR